MAAPTNQSAVTAIDLGTLPASVSQNVHDAGTTYTVWYKYTAQPGENVIGLFGFGDLVTYTPTTKVYLGPAAAPVQYLSIATINKPIQFPVVPGVIYYFEFTTNGGNPTPAVLLIEAETSTVGTVPVGSIMVPDDTEGFPIAYLSAVDADDHNMLGYGQSFPEGEQGDVLPSTDMSNPGKYLVDNSNVVGTLQLYNNNGFFNTNVVIPSFTGTAKIRSQQDGGNFWVGQTGSGPTGANARSVSGAGVVSGTIFTFPSAGLQALAANKAETILYFTGQAGSGNSQIERWDLVLDAALSDLVADFGGTFLVFDILVLGDDTIIVGYYESASDTITIVHYSTAGATLDTYSLGAVSTLAPKLAYSINNSTSFWVWFHKVAPNVGTSVFREITVSGGATISEIEYIEYEGGVYQMTTTATPLARFGMSFSCPFMIARVAQTTPLDPSSSPTGNLNSGLYQLVPGKTDDTKWVTFSPEVTEDVKKPDPTARLGDVGE